MGPIWEIGRATFSVGSPGAVVFGLMFLGLIGYLTSYILSAVGKGQLAALINLVVMFVGITMVVGTIVAAIVAVASVAGFR